MAEEQFTTPAAATAPTGAQPAASWEAPPIDQGPAPGVEWGGYGARLIAYLIDGFVLGLITVLISLLISLPLAGGLAASAAAGSARAVGAAGAFLWLLAIFAVTFLYFPFFWANGGQTPGMRPFGIRVVRDRDGGRIGWGPALIRMIGMWVAAAVMYLGFIWVFIDRRRRGWHDLIAGTVVIRDPNR